MNKSLILGWVIPGLAAIAVAGVLLAWQWPAPDAGEGVAQSGLDDKAAKTTADLVAIRAARTDSRTLRVTLDIAGDWHVNANPASLDFLIPTVLSADTDAGATVPLTVDYPAGRDIDSGLGDAPWRVYDDGSVITATLPEASATEPLSVAVQVQACHDSGRCLKPDTVRAQADAP